MLQLQTMQKEDPSKLSTSSPSFSSYSSETLAEIAARVIQEFQTDPVHSIAEEEDDSIFDSWQSHDFPLSNDLRDDRNDSDNDNDDDFEFTFVCRDPKSSPVSADDIFYNGQIRPTYPLFDRSLLFSDGSNFVHTNDDVNSDSPTQKTNETTPVRRHRLPLRKLMSEERETASCSSSTSEADDSDLDGVPPGTYCVWNPKSGAGGTPGRPCKKSNSTGSISKRWKFRDLLPRSHSDGKESFMFRAASKRTNKVAHEMTKTDKKPISVEHDGKNSGMAVAAKEGEPAKRKSYRQELIGILTDVNGVNRNLRPF